MSATSRLSAFVLVAAAATHLSAQEMKPLTSSPQPASGMTPPAPMVGDAAPDFSAPMGDASGPGNAPVALRDLRGRVVVVAFYPKDRTGGCTAEMSKFRDDYPRLFGDGVAVLPISLDDMDSHVSWAQEMHLPFALLSDQGGKIATAYGSLPPGKSYASRTVFVIGKTGKIVYRELRFNPVDQNAYDALQAAVDKAKRD